MDRRKFLRMGSSVLMLLPFATTGLMAAPGRVSETKKVFDKRSQLSWFQQFGRFQRDDSKSAMLKRLAKEQGFAAIDVKSNVTNVLDFEGVPSKV